ncbi:hypothetical protein [Streptomyces sp. UH6]|uniref:hypothetical protein n=1 Tax=Streptomyces sp. UH6 TaxID=2748379 RepID=UPI0027D23B23|nr:hypothetical protein [Streptomyces sp. UH6]
MTPQASARVSTTRRPRPDSPRLHRFHHRAGAKGLGFGIVVVPDTHTHTHTRTDAATDPTEAALRMTYYVLATRAREELHLGHDGDAEPPHLAQVPPRPLRRG